MFDTKAFSEILKKISNSYNSVTYFSDKSGVNRTYLSKYINMKLNNPPTPKILEKIANSSNGIVSYYELMKICGYVFNNDEKNLAMAHSQSDYIESRRYILEDNNFSPSEILELKRITSIVDNLKYKEEINSFLESLDKSKKNVALNLIKDSMNYLKGISYVEYYESNKKYYMCPVYGEISAGQPNWAEENIEGRIPIDPNLMNIIDPEEYYFLRVNGESMNKVVKNGAFALIHKQDFVDDGDIAVVLVNGYNATLKKFIKQDNFIILEPQSNDKSFKSQVYDKTTSIKVIGKYVGKMELN